MNPARVELTAAALSFLLFLTSTASAATYQVIYRLQGNPDAANPQAGLVADKAGHLYGTSVNGGTYGYGAVFMLTPPAPGGLWTESVLYSFTGTPDGSFPLAAVTIDSHGNLFGSTWTGGANNHGAVFELSPVSGGGWTEQVLHSFTGGLDGGSPQSTPILSSTGELFGTAFGGGSNGYGVVFGLTPPTSSGGTWTEHVIHNFDFTSSGAFPWGGLVADLSGNMYGVTESGGANGNGTAFEITRPSQTGSTEITLHSFGPAEGQNPVGNMTLDAAGNLYGTTTIGPAGYVGQFGCGVAYQLVPPGAAGGSWTENILYTFTGGADGCNSYSGLTFDRKGNLWGANSGDSGLNGDGAVFELSPPASGSGPWTETTVHDFSSGRDGMSSFSTLVLGSGGTFYGTTVYGGMQGGGEGTVFSVKP
jgi:uncharacterized repeat protein (TIGR03803 family)